MKIICINLARRTDRKEKMINQFKKARISGYEFFEAFDYMKPDPISLCSPIANIFHSHQGVIEMIDQRYLAGIRPDYTLIIEDDLVFCNDFVMECYRLVNNVPKDWDMIYLGFTPIQSLSKYTEISKGIVKLENHCLGAWGYIVNYNFLPVLAALEKKEAWDQEISKLQGKHNIYSAMPFLAYVETDFSDNSNSVCDWPGIKKHFANLQ